MHDEHVLNHSSKHSSETIQSKEIKDVKSSTSNHVIIVHDTTPLAVETMPNQDKQHEHNAHCPVGNSDRPLIEIIELCEDLNSIDSDNGLMHIFIVLNRLLFSRIDMRKLMQRHYYLIMTSNI
jgi:hypothetical protein